MESLALQGWPPLQRVASPKGTSSWALQIQHLANEGYKGPATSVQLSASLGVGVTVAPAPVRPRLVWGLLWLDFCLCWAQLPSPIHGVTLLSSQPARHTPCQCRVPGPASVRPHEHHVDALRLPSICTRDSKLVQGKKCHPPTPQSYGHCPACLHHQGQRASCHKDPMAQNPFPLGSPVHASVQAPGSLGVQVRLSLPLTTPQPSSTLPS